MAVKFATDEWVKALADELNKSEAYAEAAKTWEGDFYWIVEPEGEFKEPVVLYIDLWHGKAREAFLAQDESVKSPEFRIWAPVNVWRAIAEKRLDVMQALLTRKLKMTGNMSKIMRSIKAARELVNCATLIDTEFPI